MSVLLINSAKVTNSSITAHTRNAIIISKELGFHLIGTSEELEELDRDDYHTFVIIGSAFYPKTAEIEAWIRNGEVKRIIWINNEWQVSPNSEYARLIKDFNSLVISSVKEKNKVKMNNDFLFLNLNVLLFDELLRPISKKYDLCYFGSYRSNRRLYLQKFFHKSLFHLSSSKKNLRRINQLCGVNAIFCDKFSWEKSKETLNLFKYSLYIEDEFSHSVFTQLANRFYECLKCNVVQFFDASCKNTISKSGYNIPKKYIVKTKEELEQKVRDFNFEECLKEQKELFFNRAIKEKKEVLKCLYVAITKD